MRLWLGKGLMCGDYCATDHPVLAGALHKR